MLLQGRLKKLKALLVFQIKLGLDALRDLLLSPLAMFCFILDMLFIPGDKPGFYHKLMQFGRRTDSWISLFSSHHDDVELFHHEGEAGEKNVDVVIDEFIDSRKKAMKDASASDKESSS